MKAAIETHKLTKWYGRSRGIIDVDLTVEAGQIFGFLGPNGAGKSTTIRLLLDLIRPTSGSARVLGLDIHRDRLAIDRRVSYVPGELSLYGDLTGNQLLTYLGNLQGSVDAAFRDALIQRLELDPSKRIKSLSRGNKQKVGLVAALQHRPELLLLDEPTAGLDPLVQQTFFGMLRDAVKEGSTVFLSSHILSEVERSCDRVAIIRDGHIVQTGRVDALRDLAHHHVELRFAGDPPAAEFAAIDGVSDIQVENHLLRLRVLGPITPVVEAAARLGVTDFLSREPSLEETFLAQYGREAVEVK